MYSDFQFSEAPNMFDGFCDGSDNITLLDEQVFDLSFGTEEGSRILKRCQASGTFDDLQTKSGSDLITEALKDMSSEEQGKIQKELHGIDFDDHKVEEAPDFQDAMLLQMDHELQNLKSISTWSLQLVGIEMAERQNACYVKSRRLLLKFLRCDNWDPAKAASRLIRHFDWKLELFGEGKLTKDISLADLYPQDIKSLKEGYLQRLPERDRAGRAVLCSVYNGQIYHSPNSLVSSHCQIET